MPREAMNARGVGALLQDLSLAVIMRYLPLEDIKRTLVETQRDSIRQRLLPADVVVYLVVMLGLYWESSVRENLRILMEPLRRKFGTNAVGVPTGAAITKARRRLGSAPLMRLFELLAKPASAEKTPCAEGTFYCGFRVVAVDGTRVDIQATDANRERFGIHANQHGPAGYPQVKAVVMVECGTRVPLGCAHGGGDAYEPGLFDALVPKLTKEMLLLADRAYYDFARWQSCARRGGALLWRVKNNLNLPPMSVLEDGSYLAEIRPSNKLTKSGKSIKGDACVVRVLEYCPVFADGTQGEKARLITTHPGCQKIPGGRALCPLPPALGSGDRFRRVQDTSARSGSCAAKSGSGTCRTGTLRIPVGLHVGAADDGRGGSPPAISATNIVLHSRRASDPATALFPPRW